MFLKERRIELDLTQKELSEKLGYSTTQYISNWERGLCGPPAKKIPEIIQLLKLSKSKAFKVLLDDYEAYLKKLFQ